VAIGMRIRRRQWVCAPSEHFLRAHLLAFPMDKHPLYIIITASRKETEDDLGLDVHTLSRWNTLFINL
jgi:hypothetical protein